MRLWHSDFLPAADRAAGLAGVPAGDVRAKLSARGAARRSPVLDLNGTDDEALPPSTVDANRKRDGAVREAKYRVGRIEGLHHYLFTQDSITVVGSTWMRYIESGFFD